MNKTEELQQDVRYATTAIEMLSFLMRSGDPAGFRSVCRVIPGDVLADFAALKGYRARHSELVAAAEAVVRKDAAYRRALRVEIAAKSGAFLRQTDLQAQTKEAYVAAYERLAAATRNWLARAHSRLAREVLGDSA